MALLTAVSTRGDLRRSNAAYRVGLQWKRVLAWQSLPAGNHREAALNWLALGLLLAAWNVSNDDPAGRAQPRPVSLRGYTFVSVRAISDGSAAITAAAERPRHMHKAGC